MKQTFYTLILLLLSVLVLPAQENETVIMNKDIIIGFSAPGNWKLKTSETREATILTGSNGRLSAKIIQFLAPESSKKQLEQVMREHKLQKPTDIWYERTLFSEYLEEYYQDYFAEGIITIDNKEVFAVCGSFFPDNTNIVAIFYTDKEHAAEDKAILRKILEF